MRAAMTEDKSFSELASEIPAHAPSKALRTQPEYGQPKWGAQQNGDEDPAGGTQPIVGLGPFAGLDDNTGRHDIAVAARVEEVRNDNVRQWPITEGPSGHAAIFARRGPAISARNFRWPDLALKKMAESEGWPDTSRCRAGRRTVRGVRQSDIARRFIIRA